jgi:hypothetical protein
VLVGILALWTAGVCLVIFGIPYGAPIIYAAVIYTAILNVTKSNQPRSVAAAELLTCALAIFFLIEFSSLLYWIGAAFNPHVQTGLLSQELELNLTYALFPIEILAMVLLLFSWVPLMYQSWRPRRKTLTVHYRPTKKRNPRVLIATLDLFAIVAILVFFYPYFAGQSWIVGVDSYWRYLNPLNYFAGLHLSQVFDTSVTHGFYVGFLYLIELATGASSFYIVKFAPLILSFGITSAVFFATIRAGWDYRLALLSAICTLLWLPTTLGIYAGIQSNMVAYLFWMIFLSLYLQTKRWNAITFVLQSVISLAILVVHPWTWGVFVASLLLTVPVSWRTAWKTRSVQGALASLLISLPVSATAYQTFPSLRVDWVNAIGLYATPLIQPSTLLSFGSAMWELILNWGSFLPPLLLLLCLVGVYGLSGQEGVIRNYLVGWILAWCIGSIMVAPSGFIYSNLGLSETGMWRLLYISPLPILLALGMQKCFDLVNHFKAPNPEGSSHVVYFISIVLVAASVGLFFSQNSIVHLMIVVCVVVASIVLVVRYPNYRVFCFLVMAVLFMLLANTAFRSLYPLLLDPHNLFGPMGP